MSRAQVVALVLLVLVAAFVAVLVLRNPQPPILPADETHASSVPAETCLECHGPDGVYPQTRNHPIGSDCYRCHGGR